jgi:TolB-like protein
MISSPSSSSSGATLAVAAVLACLSACRHAPAAQATPMRRVIAVFPVQNASGGRAPIKPLTQLLDAALTTRGLETVPRRELEAVLAKHRLRYTGGVDAPMAKVLREELAVDAVVVPTLELYSDQQPPKVSIAVRVVSTDERPVVLWADAVARSGDDSPGLFKTGLVTVAAQLEEAVVGDVARRVQRWASTGKTTESCGEAGWRFGPRRVFRAPVLDDIGRRTVAVLPFTNATSRRSAEDVVLNQFVAQLARSGSFEVLDPGFIREQLLRNRVVLTGGVSIDQAMALLDTLEADLVVSGYVQLYDARAGADGAPRIEFSAFVLDRRTGELVWSSGSHGEGTDGVVFFNAGRVETASALSCRMIQGVVKGIVGRRGAVEYVEPTGKDTTANGAFYRSFSAVSAQPFRAR